MIINYKSNVFIVEAAGVNFQGCFGFFYFLLNNKIFCF